MFRSLSSFYIHRCSRSCGCLLFCINKNEDVFRKRHHCYVDNNDDYNSLYTFLFCVNRRIKYYSFVEWRIETHIQFFSYSIYVVERFFFLFFFPFNFLKISFTFADFLFLFLIFCRLLSASRLWKRTLTSQNFAFALFWMVVDAAFALLLFQFICLMMFRLFFFSSFCQTYFKRISPLPLHIYSVRPRTCLFSLNLSLTFRFHFYQSTIQALFELSLQQLCFSRKKKKRLTPCPIHFSFKPFKILFTFAIEMLLFFPFYFLFSCSMWWNRNIKQSVK